MPASSRPLVVLTHEFFPYRGGIAVYVEETARAAVALGYQTTVWAPDKPALRAHSWPFALHLIAMRGSQGWGCRLMLAQAIWKARAELAQSYVWIPEPGALLTAMYLNSIGQLPAQRLVLTLHGSEILRFASRPHRRALFQKLLDRADRVGLVSEFNRELLNQHFRVSADKIVLVSGALRSDFPPTPPLRTVKASGSPMILLTVARVHPRKGQHCVLEALTLLKNKFSAPLEYHIAGPIVNKDYQRQLESLAPQCGVTVRFLGEIPDHALPTLYAQSDIFVMTPVPHGPSVEGFGLVYLEAAAHGLPVIAHRTGGVAECVRDGQTGLLVNIADRPALASAITSLLDNPTLRTQLGEAGRSRARELSWRRNAAALFSGL